MHVYKDGSVLVNHGGTEMGQGLHTKMLQVAATALGVPLSRVRLAPTRTDKVPNTSATAASSGADLNGGAVKDACEQIRRLAPWRPRTSASTRPTCGREGGVGVGSDVSGRARRPSLRQRVQLWAAGYYRTEGLHWDSTSHAGLAVQVLLLRRRRGRGRGRRLHRRLPHCVGSTSSTTSVTASRRSSTSARSRAASSRAPAG